MPTVVVFYERKLNTKMARTKTVIEDSPNLKPQNTKPLNEKDDFPYEDYVEEVEDKRIISSASESKISEIVKGSVSGELKIFFLPFNFF